MSDRHFPGIQALRTSALAALDTVTDEAALAALRTHLFGRKAGAVVELMKEMRNIAPEDRPVFGQAVNDLKEALEARIDTIDAAFKAKAEAETLARERIDVTLPGEKPFVGATHVLTQTVEEMSAIFSRLGFTVRLGPEVELDTYNFEALNIPQGHPARDMQDTFYIGADTVLRTQTSPVQIRTMLTEPLPIQIIAPGAVYRNDDDATHSPRFHQMEGLYIGEGITFANLKGTLDYFLNEFFGSGTRVRFRPSYFPFTEPSAEADIGCVFCGGDGCRVCSHTGWLEVLGCGMVDPRVLRGCGIDDERYTGWAFGLGIDRLAMLKHGIDNIRILFQNDVRFLEQFRAAT